jgi:hypothetical protein
MPQPGHVDPFYLPLMSSDTPTISDPAVPGAAPDTAGPATEAAAAPAEVATPGTETADSTDASVATTPAAASAPAVALSPEACAQQLKQRFPALFRGTPKPVKLRIQADIQERVPGVFTKAALSAFLRRHTGSTSYLIALSTATQRFDLDGNPAGELSDEHRQAALQELARRRGNQNARREQELQERRDRASLLRDFENNRLTTANFCALKGIAPEALDAVLALARTERAEAPPRPEGAGRPDFRGPGRPGRPDARGPGPRRDGPPGGGNRPPRGPKKAG